MKQKVIYLLVFLLIGGMQVFAQKYKVLDKSDKKAPVWYESAEAEFIVASAEATTMEAAREQCLASIKRQIIQSVAQNIEFADSHTIKQTTTNNDHISEFLDQYTAEGSTRAASIPYIKGISLSKVDGSYWEKRQDKKTNKITYAYAVRYPFPASEHAQLVAEFEARDQEMEQLVTQMEKELDTIESVEEINQRINKLRPAMDYFFDKTRQEWVKGVVENYKKLPTFITVDGEHIDNKTYSITLMLKGKPITTAAMPKLTANCASKLQASPYEGDILITYDTEDCLRDEQNSIDVVFRLPGKVLKHTFYVSGGE
ncbi:hypothetical protein [Bacteroides sp. 519]|uniref:hypothetical protein n=1 Tax=Bacteroides sp. 519 TaxID=2302937 RepID=UPI0013D56033|nr:hypothetical protein [Bacteroides sp. 519]NDV58104.1 hypothetical protein [Bacteroides sp. 519]